MPSDRQFKQEASQEKIVDSDVCPEICLVNQCYAGSFRDLLYGMPMATGTSTQTSSGFPAFKSFARLNGLNKNNETTSFFDCKFFPYTKPGADPVFAVIGRGETVVCRPSKAEATGIEIIAWFHDEDKNASLNSVAWTYDRDTGDPLLCVAGQNASINVLNIRTKKFLRTLVGHGKDINDLAISPQSPWILASASLDLSVRIWSLDPIHEKQPCMLICAGEGHREGLLSLAFHATGKYLLTGGMDNVVNLWVIPDLPNEDTGTQKPTILHYPHFSTSAIHTNVVDCLTFHNDLIISRCANECVIKVWHIEDFDSALDPPTKPPTTHEFRATRSAWGGGYQILFQLDAPKTTPFWVRFGLFQAPNRRPILAMGNNESKIYLWDFQSIEEYSEDDSETTTVPVRPTQSRGRSRLLNRAARQDSIASSTTVDESVAGEEILSKKKKKYLVHDPFQPLLPHVEITIPKVTFAARQIAWSVGGEWMVVVGDQGMIAVFGR